MSGLTLHGYGEVDNKTKKKYKNEPKQNENLDDEYDMSYKRVIEQRLFQKDKIVIKETTYGPFTTTIPKHLSIPDKYKFAMYTLINKQFNVLSGEYIMALDAKSSN